MDHVVVYKREICKKRKRMNKACIQRAESISMNEQENPKKV